MHVHVSGPVHRNYEQRMLSALDSYRKRFVVTLYPSSALHVLLVTHVSGIDGAPRLLFRFKLFSELIDFTPNFTRIDYIQWECFPCPTYSGLPVPAQLLSFYLEILHFSISKSSIYLENIYYSVKQINVFNFLFILATNYFQVKTLHF